MAERWWETVDSLTDSKILSRFEVLYYLGTCKRALRLQDHGKLIHTITIHSPSGYQSLNIHSCILNK